MKASKVFGKNISASILGSAELAKNISDSGLIYRYLGFQTKTTDFDTESIYTLSTLMIKEVKKYNSFLYFHAFDKAITTNSPLNIKKGYWNSIDLPNIISFKDEDKIVFNLIENIRLSSSINIKSLEEQSFCIEHSLKSNSFFVLNTESTPNSIKFVENIRLSPWYREDFLISLFNSVNNINGLVMFLSGGYDYGGIYLNIISDPNNKFQKIMFSFEEMANY